MHASFVWTTPEGDNLIARLARVSNPANQDNVETAPKLIRYLIKKRHWSPFEMANLCVEIETTRDIGRQILRHRSFSFQEFSQRYASVDELPPPQFREARLQDQKNRQASVETGDEHLAVCWENAQRDVMERAMLAYRTALQNGIAKEVARAVLPEGLTTTRMYMNGTVRSWIHFLEQRLYEGAQKEIRMIALDVQVILREHYPQTYEAVFGGKEHDA